MSSNTMVDSTRWFWNILWCAWA